MKKKYESRSKQKIIRWDKNKEKKKIEKEERRLIRRKKRN